MKITESNPLKRVAELRKKAPASSSSATSFLDVLASVESATSEASEVTGVGAPTNVDSLLALQEVSQEEYARQKNVRHGHSLLDSLEALRHSLLMGMVPVEVLRTLESRLQQQREQINDPALLDLMDDIELRAAVELAKWEMSRE